MSDSAAFSIVIGFGMWYVIYIFTDSNKVRHLIIHENWCMSDEIICFGNVIENKDRIINNKQL